VAKVHVESFYFPGPVTRTPEIYHSFRAVAQHPTGVNVRLTEGLGDRARRAPGAAFPGEACKAGCVRSVFLTSR
jgi:hypothetical protein